MFPILLGRARSFKVPQQIYGAVVAQSRKPVFFRELGFDDSVMGRFDVLALHTLLISRRLVREGDDLAASLNQEVFDAFIDNLDQALRELGVGDSAVPKRKKRLVRTFYGMVEDFSGPLDRRDNQALVGVVRNRFYAAGEAELTDGLDRKLAGYVAEVAARLDRQDLAAIMSTGPDWPDPDLEPQ